MFVDFPPEKSLTLKQKLWKALKPGTNHLYTTNIHGRGAQTRASFLLKVQWLEAGQCLPSTSCPAWPPWATPRRACDPRHTASALKVTSTHSLQDSDLLECVKLRTCPGSGKWISASRSLNALGAWMGPVYQVWSARLSDKGISSSF